MRHRLLVLATALTVVGCQSGLEPNNPDAPTDLAYQLIPSGDPQQPLGILLEWTPPSSGLALSYDVYARSSLQEEFVLRATTTSPSFHDVGFPELQYFVQALDDQGRVMGASDTVTVNDGNTLPAPQGLASVSLNGGVELSWDPNAFNENPDLFDYYRVYSTDYNAGTGCVNAWALEGTTVSDGFVARNLANGVTRCFAVSAISIDGHESTWSNIRQDTPRFDARDVVVDAADVHPATAAFVFATADTFGVVVDTADTTADVYLSRGAGGRLWIHSSRAGVSVAPYGVSAITDLTTIDRAPTTGYADSTAIMDGYGYVVRLTQSDGTHYGAMRVVHATPNYALFDFSYQSQPNNPELLRASP
jgi:hypothetical protein